MTKPASLEKFGSYTIIKRLGSGGMADLYVAQTTDSTGEPKKVVLKMLSAQYRQDPRYVSMFLNEIMIIAGFHHENIVSVSDFGEIESTQYLVMEFVDGMDLETLQHNCRVKGIPVLPEMILRIGAQAADGLHYAHCAKDEEGRTLDIVHRDVSPQNILISRAGEVKLCDFGIAASNENSLDSDASEMKGKLHYLSPEQVAGGKLDARTDVFSLGVTLYEMLAGHHPVFDGTALSVLRALKEDTAYPLLADATPWLSSRLTGAIDKAVAFAPQERFESAGAFHKHLEEILREEYAQFSPTVLAELVSSAHIKDVEKIKPIVAGVILGANQLREKRVQSRLNPLTSRGAGIAVFAVLLVLIVGGLLWQFMSSRIENVGGIPKTPDAHSPLVSSSNGVSSNVSTTVVSNGMQNGPPPGEGKLVSANGSRSSVHNDVSPLVDTSPVEAPPVKIKPKKYGTLDINASPWASVSIDGKSYGNTPLLGLKLSVGKHRVQFANPDFEGVQKRTVVVKAEKNAKLIVDLSE